MAESVPNRRSRFGQVARQALVVWLWLSLAWLLVTIPYYAYKRELFRRIDGSTAMRVGGQSYCKGDVAITTTTFGPNTEVPRYNELAHQLSSNGCVFKRTYLVIGFPKTLHVIALLDANQSPGLQNATFDLGRQPLAEYLGIIAAASVILVLLSSLRVRDKQKGAELPPGFEKAT